MTFRDSGDIPAPAGYLSQDDFHALMDKTFGAGKWHETGGFRSQARENALRAAGAQTVAPGAVSAHSLGSADAPGAHDVVVDGLTPAQIAQHLAAVGPGVRNTFPEGAVGGQGAHLHVGMGANATAANFRSGGDQPAMATFRSGGDTPDVADGDWRKTRSLVGGVVSGAGRMVKSLSELGDIAIDRNPMMPVEARGAHAAAQITAPVATALTEAGDQVAPANRSGLESFLHGAGETVPALGAAVVDPLLGAAAFGAQGYGQSHDEALDKGASEETAQTAGLENAGIEAGLGMVPIGKLAEPLVAGVKGIAGAGARLGLNVTGDAALGASMQTGANLVARQNYDPTRAWYDQVPQSAAMMAGGGLLVHGAHEAISAAKGALRPPETPAPVAETGEPAPAPVVSASQMPATDAIRAYAGKGPVEDDAAVSPAATGETVQGPPVPAHVPSITPVLEGESVLFNTPDGISHGRVEAVEPGAPGEPATLAVRTPVGRVAVSRAQATPLPADYEVARIAQGAALEQMPQAISDLQELRQAAPKNYSLFQAIRDLGGIRTKDAQGQPDSDLGNVFDGVRPQPGVINNQSGLTPDAMREALQQRGWFGESEPTEIAGDKNPGDSIEDLTRLMSREASGRATRVYHPMFADQNLRRGDLEDQMQRAGVAADEPLPAAAAKLAAWRGEQVRADGPEIARLRARAAELGETGQAHASYDETLADVVEAEAIHGDASADDADHYENLIDGDLTPDEHEWLASARQGADGEPGPAFPIEGAGEGPGAGAGAPQGDLEPGAGAGGGGENPREGAAPRADALSETPVLRSSADQIGPGGVFAPHEPGVDALFETAEAPTSNGASFLAKPRDLGAAHARDLLPLAQRYGGRFAIGRTNTWLKFPTAEARDSFMREATDGGAKFARAPVFYSAVERLIDRSPMKAASPDQWKATLKNAPGIKQEELQWTGVGDWLDLFPKGEMVPKEKLAAFLHENGVKVDERVLGEPENDEAREDRIDAIYELADKLQNESEAEIDREDALDRARQLLDAEPQYSDWTLPGGKTYRELLLTLSKEASPPATHWDTPGVMAHVRFDERTAPDGKKVLFLEEVQSDWHQKGRDQGYATPASKEEVAAAQAAWQAALDHHGETAEGLRHLRAEVMSHFNAPVSAAQLLDSLTLGDAPRNNRWFERLDPQKVFDLPEDLKAKIGPVTAAYRNADLRLREAEQRRSLAMHGGGIRNAPFKTSWPALVMKRVTRWAVDNGFERVAWTTGDQQADRYDLQKHVGRVVLQDNSTGGVGRADLAGPFEHGVVHIWDPEGNRVLERHVSNRDELNDLVGKEMADKLLEAPANHARSAGLGVRERELAGLDVKIGGEGMKAFYDRNLVNITNDIIKKHGGKVENVDVTNPATEGERGGNRVERLQTAEADYPHLARMTPEELAEHHQDFIRRYNDGSSRSREQEDAMFAEDRALALIEDARLHPEEYEPLKQPGFDITPKLREAVEGGQPLFRRGEAAPAGQQATSGVILPGMPRGVEMRHYDNPTIAQTALINKVHDAIGRIAPFAEMRPAASIHDLGYGEVLGFSHQSGLRHLIAWSLDAPAIARHEAVHALKTAGLFRPEEWGALIEAAQTEGWVDEFNVASRYGDLPIPGQIEEAIADRFAQFDADGRKGLPGLAGTAMRKIGQALDHVRDLVRQFRRLNPDWRDVFSRMERGEIGARFGEDLRDVGAPVSDDAKFARSPRAAERDARQRAAQREIDEREGRAPTVVTRLLGNGVDAVGNRATDALERFLPESVQDIGAEVRMALNPMAAGSERAQAEAKDFANGLREIAYSHGKVDEWLAKTFTPEQRRRMYDAADEERVLRGRGQEPGPAEGKNRLNDDLRRVVDQLQARADNAFARAQALGMVKGEGQQSYVPAMLVDVSGGVIRRLKGGKGATGGRGNLTTSTGQLRQRQHETAEETQAAAQRGFGEGATVVHDIRTLNLATGKLEQAMAGRRLINKIREIGRQVGEVTVSDGAMPEANAYFTMPEHPAMVTWGPKFEKDAATGKLVTVDGPDGKPVMEAKPLYIAKEFEGPLKAVLSRPDAQLWRKLMDVKGKMMSVTMYNPLLHNMVIYGKAFPAMVAHDKLGAFTFKTYRDGALVKKDPELMSRALRSGTVPIGHQGGFQDITSIASEDPITPGKSWTAQILAATLGMGSAGRKLAIKRGVDKAGDIWHNEFLWNRVSDLQMGLWKAMSDHFQTQGLDQVTADRSASYFANMYAGSVPVEAMSRLARGLLNGVLFSRSFHVTNIGGLKAMTAGLPTDVQAQIMRDAPAMLAKAQGMVRSKAIGSLVTDFIAAWAARMIAAGALAWLLNRAFQAHGDNEEGKKDRVFVGYGPDGTASYMRLPFGKYVEEVKDWFSEPVTYAKQIMFGPTRLMLQYLSNDMGFGRKAYDPYDKSLAGLGKNLWKFVGNLGSSFLPVDHGQQLWDAATKSGQARDDAAAALAGDLTGFTISHGAPGGPAMGDIFRAEDEHQYRVTEAMPEIRKQIKAGDILGARAKMTALGIPPGLANYYVKVARNPNARMTGRKLADFNRIATPEQKAQLATDRAAAAARRQEAAAP